VWERVIALCLQVIALCLQVLARASCVSPKAPPIVSLSTCRPSDVQRSNRENPPRVAVGLKAVVVHLIQLSGMEPGNCLI
jgi:hypothetical protein